MVEYKAPVELTAGTSPGFNSGVNTNTLTDFIGWEIIPDRIGAGPQRRGADYSWDKLTGEIVLLKSGDTFQANEYWHFEFQVRITTNTSGVANYSAGAVRQYPHTLVLEVSNWNTGATEQVTYMCRREGGQSAKKGFNRQEESVNYVVYMPLPVETIQIGTPAKVYSDDSELYCSDSVKQFQRDQFNAKIWL